MLKYVHTIKPEDINKRMIKIPSCKHCNTFEVISVWDIMGPIQAIDIGKRIYKLIRKNDRPIFYVENQDQLQERLKKEGS